MPILLLVVAGIILILATSLNTLGWVLIAVGVTVTALYLLVVWFFLKKWTW